MEYAFKGPYPKIQVEKENLAYASILLSDYAGIISEDTLIHQYIYLQKLLKGYARYFRQFQKPLSPADFSKQSLCFYAFHRYLQKGTVNKHIVLFPGQKYHRKAV